MMEREDYKRAWTAKEAWYRENGINHADPKPWAFGKRLSPRPSLRLVLPIPAGTPRNAPIRLQPGLQRTDASVAPVLCCDSGSGCSLRSETPWLPRSRPLLAIRRPSATIRQDRSLRRLRSRHQRPCRASAGADSSLLSRPLACTPLRLCATDAPARTVADDPAGFAARLVRAAQAPLGLAVLALVAPLARSSSSGATPCGAAS